MVLRDALAEEAAKINEREIADAALKAGLDSALKIQVPPSACDALSRLTEAAALAGRSDLERVALEKALSEAAKCPSGLYKSKAYSRVAVASQLDNAKSALDRALEEAEASAAAFKQYAFAEVAGAAAKMGQLETALRGLANLPDPLLLPEVYTLVADAIGKARDLKAVLDLLANDTGPYLTSWAYATVAEKANMSNQSHLVKVAIENSLFSLAKATDPYLMTWAYATIAEAAATVGQKDAANAAFDAGLASVARVTDRHQKSRALAAAGRSCGQGWSTRIWAKGGSGGHSCGLISGVRCLCATGRGSGQGRSDGP